MSNSTKLTKAQKFAMLQEIPAVAENPVLTEFIAHELELLAKKNTSTSAKPTATQIANDGFKTAILEIMADSPNRMFTVTELMKCVPALADLTNQRTSALVRQLVEAQQVKRIEDKRKAYFQYAG